MFGPNQKPVVPPPQNLQAHPVSNIQQPVQPVTPANAEVTNLKILLGIEAVIRETASIDEWKFAVANETLKLTHAKQVFVFRCKQKTRLAAISGLTSFERSSTLASNLERMVTALVTRDQDKTIAPLNPDTLFPQEPGLLKDYPFKSLLWVPLLSRSNQLLGGMVLASDQAWLETDLVILKRLAGTYAHALSLLVSEESVSKKLGKEFRPVRMFSFIALLFLIFSLVFPVSMSALAPFEVAPRNPIIVTAPLDGVIEDVLVKPNAVVKKDQVIVSFADTVLKNKYELTKKDVRVAAARQKKASQLAFDDTRGQQEVRIAIANHQLKVATQNYAREILDRATIKAQRGGVVLYSDRSALLGLPVKLGERIMLIADPKNVELQIDVGVDDALLLKPNARVKIFLDSDPVNSREAVIEYIEYRARARNGQTLSYRVVARLKEAQVSLPGLGARGTAKLYGESVPLAFYLFRRPLSALRQWIGI